MRRSGFTSTTASSGFTRPEYYQRQNGERTAAHTMRCSLDAYGSWPANPA
jgi:hypothetical protein